MWGGRLRHPRHNDVHVVSNGIASRGRIHQARSSLRDTISFLPKLRGVSNVAIISG
jgi:hypothetical protein